MFLTAELLCSVSIAQFTICCSSLFGKTLVMGEPLNASKVFSSITVFDFLRDNIAEVLY
jgi:hypothetical protein